MGKNTILFFGAAGSGKGTQSDLLCEKLKILKVSTGDIIRSFINEEPDNKIAKKLKDTIAGGNLVDTATLIEMLYAYISKKQNDYSIFLFDGFPRSLEQDDLFTTRLVPQLSLDVRLAILFDIDVEHLVERIVNRMICLQCGAIFNKINYPSTKGDYCDKCGAKLTTREDDSNIEAIHKRFAVFEKEVGPVINIYKKKNILYSFNAADSPELIHNNILTLLKEHGL